MKQKVIILGGVGNGTVITQAILDATNRGQCDLEVAGYLSDRMDIGELIEGYPVVAKTSPDNVAKLTKEGYKFIYTVYRIDGQVERLQLFDDLGLNESNLASFIHPTAYVAPDVVIEPGVVIMPYVMISAAAHLCQGTIVMTGATIGHNTTIGRNGHIASQAVVGAYITTGRGVHIGLNCCIRENVKIGNNAAIGMGAVQTKDVGDGEIWAGNPSKFLRMAK
jgi:sugar O-acyltransferase (sialic acid O-acetyltransferase NeuD family)